MQDKFLLGDSYELIKTVPGHSIDIIITDPPYIIDIHPSKGMGKHIKKWKEYKKFIDGFDYTKMFPEFERVLKKMNLFVFCSNKQISQLMQYWENRGFSVHLLIWHKNSVAPFVNNTYLPDVEFIIYVREKGTYMNNDVKTGFKSKVFRYPSPGTDRIHETQKPVDLIKRILHVHSKPGDVMLDTFAGSGTMGVAAMQMKRNYIMFELEPAIFERANRRLKIERQKARQMEIF